MASPPATPTVARTATSHAPTPAPSASPTVDVRRMRAVLPYVARGVELATRRPRVWGMQFAIEFDADQNAQDIRFELPRARSVGIGGIRTALRWDEVEPTNTTPDEFDWAAADARLGAYAAGGMDLLIMVVGYPAWATEYACGGRLRPGMDVEWREFIRAAAERYRAAPYRVAAWEIGNEVDGTLIIDNDDLSRPQGWGYAEPTTPYGGCWAGRAAEYKTFLQAAYEEIKAVAPGTPVTLGGLAYVDSFAHGLTGFDIDFLDDLLEAGGGPYFDFFNYHWFLDYPFQPPGVDRHRRAMATLARHGFPKPVWLSETYRLTVPGDRESEATQVRFLAREIIDMLAQPEIERVYWYGWVDFPPTVADQVGIPQRGLVNAGHRAKAGLSVLPHTIAHTNGVATDLSTDRAVVWRFGWPRAAETHVVAWSRDGRPARVTLAVPVGRRATVRSFPPSSVVSGKCCNERVLPVQGAQMTLDVGAESVFVEIGP